MKNDKGSSGFLDTARLRDRAKDLLTERFSNPTARVLSSVGFTPNRVTIAGGLIAVAAGAVAAKGRLPEAGALVLAAGALDLVDGAMPVTASSPKVAGAVLDSLDRWVRRPYCSPAGLYSDSVRLRTLGWYSQRCSAPCW